MKRCPRSNCWRSDGQLRLINKEEETYSEKYSHCCPSLLQLINVADHSSSDAEAYAGSKSLDETACEESREVVRECNTQRAKGEGGNGN